MKTDDLIVHPHFETRPNAAAVCYRTVARVLSVHDDIGFVTAKALRVFCWVDGYPQLGRYLPPDSRPIGYALAEVSPLFCAAPAA